VPPSGVLTEKERDRESLKCTLAFGKEGSLLKEGGGEGRNRPGKLCPLSKKPLSLLVTIGEKKTDEEEGKGSSRLISQGDNEKRIQEVIMNVAVFSRYKKKENAHLIGRTRGGIPGKETRSISGNTGEG